MIPQQLLRGILKNRTFMNREIASKMQYRHAADCYDAYMNIIQAYEQTLGGPANCRAIPEYQAAWRSMNYVRERMRLIEQWQSN